jgi:hypothetical protein
VLRRWDLPATTTKILWIHSDEKWFYGLVARKNAKACPSLGIDKQTYSAHHKSHIKKVMVHCTVGYLFDGHVENGGKGFLIAIHRCAAFRVPLRDVFHSSRDPITGRIKFKGNAVKNAAGVPYLVDCNVTGNNPGTPTKPMFPLRKVWEHSLLPAIEDLVSVGGLCEGAQVIYQEDNAGPHQEDKYTAWMAAEFLKRGWKVELQAPQGPYTNVLDLALFPSMSHRHSAELQIRNNTEASLDKIWKTTLSVWDSTSSAEVARAFVLALRVMRLIVKENGDNAWLAHGTPHCRVRQDFQDTATGIIPKTSFLMNCTE